MTSSQSKINPLDLSDKGFMEMCSKIYERQQLAIKKKDELQKLALQTDKMVNDIVPCKDDRCFQRLAPERSEEAPQSKTTSAPKGGSPPPAPPPSPGSDDSDDSERPIDEIEKEYYEIMEAVNRMNDTEDEYFTDYESLDSLSDSD